VEVTSSKISREAIGQASFSVSARVAMQLGRESISSSIVAILELVKNAYDADAEKVVIRFVGLETPAPVLIIQDDGSGMSKSQLTNNWLVIGTKNKAYQVVSGKWNRVMVGEKGLGRLGLDRLAHITQVQTFAANEEYGTEIEIDWTKYEESNERLEEIKHGLYRIPKFIEDLATGTVDPIEKGTRLVLLGLKDEWTQSNVQRLRDELALLVSPFGSVNNFAIQLETGMNWDAIDGEIGSRQILDAAEWTLLSDLDVEGNIYHKLSARNGVEFEYTDHWGNAFRSKDTKGMPLCGPIHFELYFFERDKAEELNLKRGQIQRFLASNQGVRIYRDQFRVKPYGDPSGEGDWLNLALRRVQNPKGVRQPGKWVVGYNQVVGAVFIERNKNDTLLDQTNREGIVEGPAFYDLRRYVLNAIEYFESQRQKYERSQENRRKIDDARDAAEKSSKAATQAIDQAKEQIRSDYNTLRETLSIETADSKVADAIESSIQEAESRAMKSLAEAGAVVAQLDEDQRDLIRASEEQEEDFEEQKNTLGNLASLGILAAAFGHETLSLSSQVLGYVRLLQRHIRELYPALLREQDHQVEEELATIERAASKINSFADFSLANVKRDKRTKTNLNLTTVVRDVFAALRMNDTYHIDVEIDIQPELPNIRAFRIDWESIFINFATNAKWAIENNRDPNAARKIRVRAWTDDLWFWVSFADSGFGISSSVLERIFEPVFSTKTNDKGDVIGTGMGLAIVESLVQSYDGSISAVPTSDLGGAEFHIKMPLGKLRGERR
jgi:signal transduction histidine kinase